MEHLLAVRQRVKEQLPETRIIKDLIEGRIDHDAYVRYLINAYNYAQFSPKVMAIAAARCMDSHPELAVYLLRHAEEEQGHEAWALADLADLGVGEQTARTTRPVPACTALIGLIHYLAGYANPVGLFGWMYVLEAVGDDLGTPIAERLAGWLQGRASRFVERHGVADTDHTQDLTAQIGSFVQSERDRADVDAAADVVADLYVRMFHEIGGELAQWN